MIRESLRIVADTMPAAAVHCSRDGRFLWVNPCYARWVARSAEEIVGQHIAEVVGDEVMRGLEPHIARVLKGEQLQFERLARLAGLGERWVSWMYTPTADGWVAIGTDIHERKLAEEALKQEHQRKDDFLAALAHELRNPLAPIRNAVAILEKKSPLDPEVAYSRAVIERQIDQLTRLIGDLVDIEHISRGSFALSKQRVTLESVVDMALESSRAHINASGHRLSVLLPSQRVLELYGHEVRVAYDGASALRIGDEFRPRVAVLDIAMPGTNGYDVARAMRRRQGGEVTLVALTGWGQAADRPGAIELGFGYHLVKAGD